MNLDRLRAALPSVSKLFGTHNDPPRQALLDPVLRIFDADRADTSK